MYSIDNMLDKIGQLFIVGFPGEKPPASFLDFIAQRQIGGVILYEENCPTHLAARENIERIRSCLHLSPPFIAIDQEGGRVCRLRGAPAEFRAPAEYGRGNNIERFREDYSRSAVYMESLGINLNLAPVADIFVDERNTCLEGRCFADTPERVAAFVAAAVEVSRASGLLSCLKHFPGLGAATTDPHEATAVADYDRFVWQQREKIPFDVGVKAGADLLMTTHIHVPELADRVVTESEQIISELARADLEFDGPLITDDLIMQGAAVLGSVEERAVAAFRAGHDLLLFGSDHERVAEVCDYLADACRRGAVPMERLKAALDRVAGLKFRLGRTVAR